MAEERTLSHRMWTLPNTLSMARLAGVPVFLWLVLGPEDDGWALGLLMVSGVTDWLDGYFARRLNQKRCSARCWTRSRTGSTSSRWSSAWRCAR